MTPDRRSSKPLTAPESVAWHKTSRLDRHSVFTHNKLSYSPCRLLCRSRSIWSDKLLELLPTIHLARLPIFSSIFDCKHYVGLLSDATNLYWGFSSSRCAVFVPSAKSETSAMSERWSDMDYRFGNNGDSSLIIHVIHPLAERRFHHARIKLKKKREASVERGNNFVSIRFNLCKHHPLTVDVRGVKWRSWITANSSNNDQDYFSSSTLGQ